MSEEKIKNKNNGAFVKAKDKYSDMKSSAVSLIFIGLLGFTVLALDYFDILPIKLTGNENWLFTFVMIVLFAIFIISGIYTLHSAKKIKATISDEESQTDTIITWILDNLNANDIDKKCEEKRLEEFHSTDVVDDEATTAEDSEYVSFYDISDELKSFGREEVIAEILKKEFDIDDESYISSLLDDVYDEIFG